MIYDELVADDNAWEQLGGDAQTLALARRQEALATRQEALEGKLAEVHEALLSFIKTTLPVFSAIADAMAEKVDDDPTEQEDEP